MKKILLIFCSLLAVYSNAQTEAITFNDSKIVIDGRLDESIWNKLPTRSDFSNYYPKNTGTATQQTTVRLFHNGTHLYISAVYQDTTPVVQLGSLKRDDISNSVAASDAFIIVIDTYNQQQNGYYFATNMGSTQSDALIERTDDGFLINRSWNTVWKAKTSVKGNQKIYEIEIPLKALGYATETPTWGLLFYTRDIKTNEWTTYTHMDRNYRIFDLRFTKPFMVEKLSNNSTSRLTITPSLTINHQEDVTNRSDDTTLKPSLDVQYNVTSSLKLDATIYPDFSQIDVDQQVTNLTRFAVDFPEQRNFFLENNDLFSNLGTDGVNPFYSRRIGAVNEILFGVKLSGNIARKTRLGVLDVATKEKDTDPAQNYAALILQQQLSNAFTTTGFLINRQQTEDFDFLNNYNRVGGLNINYKSGNNKWTGLLNYGKSYTSNYSGDTNFYNIGVWYNTLKTSWNTAIKKVGKNYITDIGFVPRLLNYDPISDTTVREGYTHANGELSLMHFPKKSKKIDSYRYLLLKNNSYWDKQGVLTQSSFFFNNALWFSDLSSIYANVYYEYEDLKYAFDILKNENFIEPDVYNYVSSQIGYNSVYNKKVSYNIAARYGSYYNGFRSRGYMNMQYRLLPFAKLQARYEVNKIDLRELGKKTFHLARFIGELFFSNRLNWTTYVQYNTQFDNFNINSRLQWEYKPLSYVYLVVTDNFNKNIHRANWGVSFKANYRFNL
ncbi:DUF5916 domain-containing protein [Aquimarina longa]|uniref:DUF5916 domain-containing protein n=1 Tax=Aquimarina longa TaxID=1080221 RepID=UPI0007809493|nr:DUF5916 domain-containing protein [Aquimarina longa]